MNIPPLPMVNPPEDVWQSVIKERATTANDYIMQRVVEYDKFLQAELVRIRHALAAKESECDSNRKKLARVEMLEKEITRLMIENRRFGEECHNLRAKVRSQMKTAVDVGRELAQHRAWVAVFSIAAFLIGLVL